MFSLSGARIRQYVLWNIIFWIVCLIVASVGWHFYQKYQETDPDWIFDPRFDPDLVIKRMINCPYPYKPLKKIDTDHWTTN